MTWAEGCDIFFELLYQNDNLATEGRSNSSFKKEEILARIKSKQTTLAPFLVESGQRGGNIFRVVSVADGVTREQIETLLTKLPIRFKIHRFPSCYQEHSINEPLEVHVEGSIVYIYPTKDRIIACTTLDSWGSADVVSQMHVDNMMDTLSPGRGQLRTCIHFDPKVLGIEGWPNTSEATAELEVDIHVYSIGKTLEPQMRPPQLDKFQLRDLLQLIAGKERSISVRQFDRWRDLIMYSVAHMRFVYEGMPGDDPTRDYYGMVWREFDAATDSEGVVRALDSLVSAINYQ